MESVKHISSERRDTLAIERLGKETRAKYSYYDAGGIETLEVIKAKLSHEGFIGYLTGNVLKYVMRHPYKEDSIADLEKARVYLDIIIKEIENERRNTTGCTGHRPWE